MRNFMQKVSPSYLLIGQPGTYRCDSDPNTPLGWLAVLSHWSDTYASALRADRRWERRR